MKKIKTWTLGVVMTMFCMCIMVMTPNTAWAALSTDSNATTIDELMAELEDLEEGYEINVANNIKIDNDKDVVLDLNDNTITFKSGKYFGVENGSLTIKGEGTINGDIRMYGSKTKTENYSNVTIDENVVVDGAYGVMLREVANAGAGAYYGMNLTVNGTIKGDVAGIWVMGNIHEDEGTNTITINKGATVSGGAVGIVLAGDASAAVYGNVSADTETAIEVRAGELTVFEGANVSVKKVALTNAPAPSGSATKGAALAIAQHTTREPINVKIEGGTFKGTAALYVVDPELGDMEDVSLSITGGKFESYGESIFDVTDLGQFIAGGTFVNGIPKTNYLAEESSVTINVDDDITAEAVTDLKNGQSMTINLDNGSISAPEAEATVFGVEEGSLTIKGKGTINGDIRMYGSQTETTKYSNVKIGKNVVVDGTYGVMLREGVKGVGGSYYGMNLTVDGTINGSVSGIWVMGNIFEDSDTNIITISENATVKGGSVGLVLSGDASATVSGTVSADTESAIEVRAGKLTVLDGAKIKADAKSASSGENPNGTTTIGAGIAIAQHETKLPIDVTVKGGTISAYAPIYQSNPQNNGQTAVEKVKVSISGGTFNVINDGTQSVYSQNLDSFITGGTYSVEPNKDYIADGYKAAQNTDGQWEIVADGSVPVLIKEGSEITVYAGEDFMLTAVTTPEAPVTWEINEKTLVTYNVETGTFTANAHDGETWVKATVQVGGDPENTSSAKCTIKVLKQELSAETLALSAEEKATLTVNGKATKGVTWSSDDAAIAAVDQNGNVTAVSAGTATITATVNKVVKLLCTVTVSEKEVAATQGNTGTNVDPVTMEAKKNAAVSEAISNITVPEGVDAVGFKNSVEGAVADAISEAVDTVETDVLENTVATQPVEGLAEAAETALKNQELKENEKALVYVNVVLEDVDVDVTTTVDENNEVTAAAVPTKLTFTVEPYVKVFDADGNVKGEDTKIENKDLNGTFKVRLPIPSSITEKYATIVHKSTGYADKTYTLLVKEENGQKYVEMTLTHFSTFEVSFTNTKPSTGSTGGGSYSTVKKVEKKATAVTGAWAQDANGWWYRYADGTWPAAKWVELDWNGEKTWYYFNPNGYMHSGWLLDGGNWYFLHNVADGTQGYMYTGWKQIDGKWYYFNPLAGGPMGSLLVNTVTPDGYTVDANGVWVQ